MALDAPLKSFGDYFGDRVRALAVQASKASSKLSKSVCDLRNRFDLVNSLLGSIGTRCTCHRVPPLS
eukprot:10440329-Alexandrium_andersonii.AAC.1